MFTEEVINRFCLNIFKIPPNIAANINEIKDIQITRKITDTIIHNLKILKL